MAVDVTRLPRPYAAPLRARVLGTPLALGLLVATSAVVNVVVAFARATPRYLPDEFLYSQLARSLAEGRGPRVLGEPSAFPAMLEPLLSSVTWLPGDPELAFRLTQALHGVVMSLAVVPVYVIGRKLGLRPSICAFGALVAVLSPDLLYAGYATADALGYTLALGAVAAGLTVLIGPSDRGQVVFLVFAGLATFARVQYALLLPVLAVACLLVERGSLRVVWARFRWIHVTLGAAVLGAAALGPVLAGRYAAATGFLPSTDAAAWMPRSAFLLTLATGVAIVPGAVAWLAGARKVATRERRAFAWLAVLLLGGLLSVAAIMAVETGSERFFERYLMLLIPLLAVAFGCWVEDGRPRGRIAAGTAIVLLVGAARLPVSEYAAGQGAADSPLLLAVRRLEDLVGTANSSLLVAATVSVALAGAAWPALRRGGHRPAIATTIAALAVVSIGAHAEDLRLSSAVAQRTLAASPSWVDESGARDVLLLQTAASPGDAALAQSFWNSSVTHGALLGDGAVPIDGARDRVTIARSGLLKLGGRLLDRPVLVATKGTQVVPAEGRLVAGAPGFALLRPDGPVRLRLLAEGLLDDGWLAPHTTITIWPAAGRGGLRLALALPSGRPAASLQLRAPGIRRTVRLEPGRKTTLQLPVTARGPWRLELSTNRPFGLDDGRLVAARASDLEFVRLG